LANCFLQRIISPSSPLTIHIFMVTLQFSWDIQIKNHCFLTSFLKLVRSWAVWGLKQGLGNNDYSEASFQWLGAFKTFCESMRVKACESPVCSWEPWKRLSRPMAPLSTGKKPLGLGQGIRPRKWSKGPKCPHL
jgi:hypothetical protein